MSLVCFCLQVAGVSFFPTGPLDSNKMFRVDHYSSLKSQKRHKIVYIFLFVTVCICALNIAYKDGHLLLMFQPLQEMKRSTFIDFFSLIYATCDCNAFYNFFFVLYLRSNSLTDGEMRTLICLQINNHKMCRNRHCGKG